MAESGPTPSLLCTIYWWVDGATLALPGNRAYVPYVVVQGCVCVQACVDLACLSVHTLVPIMWCVCVCVCACVSVYSIMLQSHLCLPATFQPNLAVPCTLVPALRTSTLCVDQLTVYIMMELYKCCYNILIILILNIIIQCREAASRGT